MVRKTTGMNSLDLVGWITMRNQSGKTFENARIKLLAGDVSKIQDQRMAGRCLCRRSQSHGMDAPLRPWFARNRSTNFTSTRSSVRHPARQRNQAGGVRRLHRESSRSGCMFMTARRQISTAITTTNRSATIPVMVRRRIRKVWVMEEFKNSETNHLGIALPKGRLRFYRRDTDGSLQFVGENVIDHTPKDEMIRVYTGNAFDVVGERKRTNYHVDSNAALDGRDVRNPGAQSQEGSGQCARRRASLSLDQLEDGRPVDQFEET